MTEQNPYSGELAAMAHALNKPRGLKGCIVTLLTSNKAAALTLNNLDSNPARNISARYTS
jgi:hypothetical protein